MAIDPRISLAGSSAPNVGQRFGQALTNLQNIDLLNQRRDIAPLQLEQAQRANELAIAQQPANLQAAEFAASGGTQALLNAEQEARLDQFNAQSLNTALASGNPATVTEALNQQLQRATKFNLTNDIAEAQQALQMVNQEGGLQALQQATTAALVPAGARTKQFVPQASAPITDPATGQVSTPVFDPNTQTTKLIPIEGAIQQTPEQIATSKFETAKKEAELDVKTTQRKETIKKTVARTSSIKKEFSDRRKLAARSTRKIKEAQKLSEKATQGLVGASKVQLGRAFPGIDTSNEVALSGAFKSLALDELQKFKGPTTDFEFRVTEDIAGSLGDGAFANKARLASLERANWFMDRESKQFNEHSKAGHDPDEFFFNINELVTPKKGGKSYSLQSLQDTAVANHISIDEVIKRLSK